jgi:acetyl-CoA C-acetyltransferase
MDPQTPVIVGAGQVTHRPGTDGQRVEPVALAVRALRAAGRDSGPDSGTGEALLRRAESVRCVAITSWQYRDAAALVAADLGINPRETVQTNAFGGDGPQRLVNETARAIAAGELDVALVCGAESVATLIAAQRAGEELGWRTQDDGVAPTRVSGRDRYPVNQAEADVGLPAPLDMYALIESAVRARSGADPDSHLQRIAGLWSRFSRVAAENEFAWIRRGYTAAEIATPTAENRAVSSPYTKLLAANIQVDQAAGLIICSASAAERAGVPRDRWVFIHAGAQAQDEWHVTERAELAASPAIRAIGDAALAHAGLDIDEVAYVDLYSCFPSAVQIGAGELGLALEDPARPLTLTGGLTFAGGPGNNYTMHSIATLVGRLRDDPGAYGLTTALGWYATKHALGVYSAKPPARPFASLDPEPEQRPARRARTDFTGTARLEAFTVSRGRDGAPAGAAVSAVTPGGDRALVRVADGATITGLLEHDHLGTAVRISGPGSLELDAR